jgi:hypothetical protein
MKWNDLQMYLKMSNTIFQSYSNIFGFYMFNTKTKLGVDLGGNK